MTDDDWSISNAAHLQASVLHKKMEENFQAQVTMKKEIKKKRKEAKREADGDKTGSESATDEESLDEEDTSNEEGGGDEGESGNGEDSGYEDYADSDQCEVEQDDGEDSAEEGESHSYGEEEDDNSSKTAESVGGHNNGEAHSQTNDDHSDERSEDNGLSTSITRSSNAAPVTNVPQGAFGTEQNLRLTAAPGASKARTQAIGFPSNDLEDFNPTIASIFHRPTRIMVYDESDRRDKNKVILYHDRFMRASYLF